MEYQSIYGFIMQKPLNYNLVYMFRHERVHESITLSIDNTCANSLIHKTICLEKIYFWFFSILCAAIVYFKLEARRLRREGGRGGIKIHDQCNVQRTGPE